MKQQILSYQKAPLTQAKWSSLFHCWRVLLSNSVADLLHTYSFTLLIMVNSTYSPLWARSEVCSCHLNLRYVDYSHSESVEKAYLSPGTTNRSLPPSF